VTRQRPVLVTLLEAVPWGDGEPWQLDLYHTVDDVAARQGCEPAFAQSALDLGQLSDCHSCVVQDGQDAQHRERHADICDGVRILDITDDSKLEIYACDILRR